MENFVTFDGLENLLHIEGPLLNFLKYGSFSSNMIKFPQISSMYFKICLRFVEAI